jgi:fatty-acid peroxygenase
LYPPFLGGNFSVGPRHWPGKRARKRAERWVGKNITDIRRIKFSVPKGSPAFLMACHHDLVDKLLDTKMAAIELMYMIRPTVAIS